jgi:phenylalanyl-tRNA synthetase beta chain
MADRGYREAITYSFVDPALQRSCFPTRRPCAGESHLGGLERDARVAVARPAAGLPREHAPSANPGAAVRDRQEVRVQAQAGARLREIDTLAGIATGARWPEQWGSAREPLDFYDVKADVEMCLR